MSLEMVFSVASMLATFGWVCLLLSPFIPVWSDRIAGCAIPILLSAGYLGVLILSPANQGGYGSLAEVVLLFSVEQAVLAGWVHFLAFDLFIGAWICRSARENDIRFWLVIPSMAAAFLFGPVGYLMFCGVLGVRRLLAKPA